jgi:1-aminocyclopropane-1-carboxylate deaminase/D-cysteine desulfhydrase-like pyridoxal-dependent ACC family enzyme
MVGPHYYIPVGGHNWLGGLGYVKAAAELNTQAQAQGIGNAWVVLAAGSGGTLSGMMAGLSILESRLKLQAVDVGKLWKGFSASITHLAGEICLRLGFPKQLNVEETPIIEDFYVGEAYGIPSRSGLDAITYLARKEGILLDPVYTGKAFAGMLDLCRKGQLGRNEPGNQEPVIFLHTGGAPALFANGQIPP